MFYLTASDEDIEAYEESRIQDYVYMSVADICIEYRQHVPIFVRYLCRKYF